MDERGVSNGPEGGAILIYGPTASGKSALAFALARRLGGAIVNADSQQVFGTWRILTARPSEREEARAPHFLYGHVPVDSAYSVGRWLGEVQSVLAACAERGLVPIITGGTGLYFRALTEGLASIPPVPPAVRSRGEEELRRVGLPAFAEAFAERDPETAAGLDLDNPVRVLRAWEVLEATGKPLARWQTETGDALLPNGAATRIALTPPREWLYSRCDTRLGQMIAEGALAEVRTVASMNLPPSRPGSRALGADELSRHLRGEATLPEALEAARTATRRYAKRQLTWARGQMADWTSIESTAPKERMDAVLAAR